MIELCHVSKTFPHKHRFMKRTHAALEVLQDISLSIGKGEFVSLVGPSGCGKSTMLRMMAGLILPDEGEIRKNGQPIVGAGRDRCVVFQDYVLFPWMNVRNNVALGLKLQHMNPELCRVKTEWALDLVGLRDYAHMYPEQLSGGMKQRVAIGRALVMEPEILLMDEPFGALDPMTRMKLQEELAVLCKKNGFTTVFVTHDPEEAVYLSDRIVVLAGNPAEIAEIIQVDRVDREDRSNPRFLEIRNRIMKWGMR